MQADHYLRLAGMIVLSLISMYVLMYSLAQRRKIDQMRGLLEEGARSR